MPWRQAAIRPAVLNDLGHSLIKLGRLTRRKATCGVRSGATTVFRPPITTWPSIFLNHAMETGATPPPEALACATRAVEIGPESGELCRDMADLQVLAAKRRSGPAAVGRGICSQGDCPGNGRRGFPIGPGLSGLAKGSCLSKGPGRAEKGVQPPSRPITW